MTTRRLLPTIVLAAGLLGLTACGGGSSSSGNTAPADADVVVRAVDGIAWNSKQYTATAGEVSIYGVNDSSVAHNLYVLDESEAVVGDFIDLPKRGADGTRVFTLEAGTYRIVCKIPGHTNMNSELTVG
jgi:plastocyanin